MKRILLCLNLFLYTSFMYSQNEYQKSEDSLLLLINKSYDITKKIAHYSALCTVYKTYNSKKLKICNKKLLQVLQNTKANRGLNFYYSNLAILNIQEGNYTQAIINSKKAADLSLKYRDWDNYILNTTDYALNLSLNHEINKALLILNELCNVAITKKSKYLANVYYGFGCVYNDINEYPKAIYYAKKALSIEKTKINNGKIYHLISNIYTSLQNYKSAIEFNKLSLQTNNDNLSYKSHKAIILQSMGLYNEALTLFLSFNNPKYLHCISNCYLKLKKFKLANKYVNQRLKIGFTRQSDEVAIKVLKSKIALTLNHIGTAKKYINQSLDLLKNDYHYELKIEMFKIKQKVEEKLMNYKLALYYCKKAALINEENFIFFNKSKLQLLQVELEVKEKSNRIKSLHIAQLKTEAEINTKNKYIFYTSIALFIAIAFVLFYLKNYKTIKSKNQSIEIEKSIIKKSLQEKETLLQEIHHRLKNNMQLVISLLKIQARDTKQMSIPSYLQICENRIQTMALIHEHLYETAHISYVNFDKYATKLSRSVMNSFSGVNNIKLETEIDNIDLKIETSIPLGLIINELLVNAFKHAFVGKEKGIIKIKLFENARFYHLEIIDDGVGITDSTLNGTSLGLKIVKLLVAQIGGVINISSKSGTKFIIKFTNNFNANE